jgi:hypothetical protein
MKSLFQIILFVLFLQIVFLLLMVVLGQIFPQQNEAFSNKNMTNLKNTIWSDNNIETTNNLENFIQNACTITKSDKTALNVYVKKIVPVFKTLNTNCDSSGNCPNKKANLDIIKGILWTNTDNLNDFINNSTSLTSTDQFLLQMYLAKMSDELDVLYLNCDASGNNC